MTVIKAKIAQASQNSSQLMSILGPALAKIMNDNQGTCDPHPPRQGLMSLGAGGSMIFSVCIPAACRAEFDKLLCLLNDLEDNPLLLMNTGCHVDEKPTFGNKETIIL